MNLFLKNIVKIQTPNDLGSGLLYFPQNSEKTLIFTAKHCIKGQNFDLNPNKEEIKIDFQDLVTEKAFSYTLQADDLLVCDESNEHDALIIVISRRIIPNDFFQNYQNYIFCSPQKNDLACCITGFPTSVNNEFKRTLCECNFHPDQDFPHQHQITCVAPFTSYTGSDKLAKGYSGGCVFMEIQDHFLVFGIITDYEVKNKRFKYADFELFKPLLGKVNLTIKILNLPNFSILKELNLTNEWFKSQNEGSIADLGVRYSPKLNVKLPISQVFDGIDRNEKFVARFKILVHNLLKEHRDLFGDTKFQTQLGEVIKFVFSIKNEFKNINFSEITLINTDKLIYLCNQISKNVHSILSEYYIMDDKEREKAPNKNYYSSPFNSQINGLREFTNTVQNFEEFCESEEMQLANNPFLLINGEAGIGKSHLLGDIVSNRLEKGKLSLFFLGQKFVEKTAPFQQILSSLGLSCTEEYFLKALDTQAQITGSRLIIFIDAINEGEGKNFWKDHIRSFKQCIEKYQWLGLVMSVRSSYENSIFSGNNEDGFVKVTHEGFGELGELAIKTFFEYYKIDLPKTPLLNPEFNNPLFLKLFCEGLHKKGLHTIPEGYAGISQIMSFYFENINANLQKQYQYSERINLVLKVIEAIVEGFINEGTEHLPFEKAFDITQNITQKHIPTQTTFLQSLIREGVFSENRVYKDYEGEEYEDIIYFSYQRFCDHLKANFLLKTLNSETLVSSFQEGGILFSYFRDEYKLSWHSGLIEALSIQLPEKSGKELYELVPQFRESETIISSFLESLIWRKTETITEKVLGYINKVIFQYQYSFENFLGVVLLVNSNPKHFFNASRTHIFLSKFSLAKRDAFWIEFLYNKYPTQSIVKRLIDWAWSEEDKGHISDESTQLLAITLTWFLASNNRALRDCSTKALISLLENRLHLLIDLLKQFEGIDDPYIYERLYAVAYGCAVRQGESQKEAFKELVEYIYQTVFNKEGEIYPHILLRDYARHTIEYALYLGLDLSIDAQKIRPPYQSIWIDEKAIPSMKELEKNYAANEYNSIRDSVLEFGDFARYIIGTNSNSFDWSNKRINEEEKNINLFFSNFIQSLNKAQTVLWNNLISFKHKESDLYWSILNIRGRNNKRYGKDYKAMCKKFQKSLNTQQLHLYFNGAENILKLLIQRKEATKHRPYNKNTFDLEFAQRWIFNKVIELGWKPELHGEFDKKLRDFYSYYERNTNTKIERIGKKYQWLAYHEFVARVSDHFQMKEARYSDVLVAYEGTWQLFVRDIDPTNITWYTEYPQKSKFKVIENFWWKPLQSIQPKDWNLTNAEWLKSKDLPDVKHLIDVKNNSDQTEWLVLETYPEWREPNKLGKVSTDPYKQIWYQVRGYIIKKEEAKKVISWAKKQNFRGRWMPEAQDNYRLYSREYYWSPAFQSAQKEENTGWRKLYDRQKDPTKTEKFVGNVLIAIESWLWESGNDFSKEGTIRMFKPCETIYRGMGMKYGKKEGEFLNQKNELVCFDPSIKYGGQSCLVIRKNDFLAFLEQEGFTIFWTLLGEKLINQPSNYLRKDISGCYFLNQDNKIEGNYTIRDVND